MNNRERFLIIILAAATILLGGFKLLIEPEMKNVADAKSTLEQAENSWNQVLNNREKSAEIKTSNNDLKIKIKTASRPFFPELDADNVHIFFDGLARKAGINYTSFIMTNRTVSQIIIPEIINNEISYPAKDAAQRIENMEKGTKTKDSEEMKEQKSADPSKAQPKDLLEMMTVSLQFKGNYNQVVAIVDEITKCGRFVRISSLDMSMVEGSLNVSVTADCFGIAKWVEDEFSEDKMAKQPGKSNPFIN
ncbi:MAG: type 4a pilus biogenesis protein PilO [Oscillospiraceae bacterium]|nr:type 4a pilus biogenesis protein PilO [Oscillospiraceae bacterium]MDD4414246.1 type 4a pilus biogenesis protein PilO [Oscillospiraceae bacterium]